MVRKCIYDNCKTRAHFNKNENKIPLYCSKHKLSGMVDIISKKCVEIDCTKRPSFNYKDSKTPTYCSIHKKDNMVDIVNKNKICIELNCITIANYNFNTENRGIYCNIHKKDNMIDIVNRKCKENGCMIQPTYNYIGNKKAVYCNIHKKDDMIDVTSKKCKENGCMIQPTYNYIGNKKAVYCNIHKKDDMIDVKNRKCIENNCNTIPTFGFKNDKKALYCNKHKKSGMIGLRRLCSIDECNKTGTFGKTKNMLYCSIHKTSDMVDLRHKVCKTILCNTIITGKYKSYCLYCFIHLFPNEKNTRNYKTKEKHVSDKIQEWYSNMTLIFDKQIKDGCSRKRPDIIIDLGYQVIIIEIDENRHINYDCNCENKRIMELSKDINHRPLIIIRFNPDEYYDKTNNLISSCWKINYKGIMNIHIDKIKEWNERLSILKENISYWIDNKTEKTIEIIQLFYNQNNI